MALLVTRAAPDATRTAEALGALGRTAIVSPVLTVTPIPTAGGFGGVQAVLLTSATAARLAPDAALAVPALAVGEATAEAALARGFRGVRSADGAGGDLAALAVALLKPEAGLLVHLSGEAVAFDLTGALAAAGFAAERRILYRADPVAALSAPARAALHAGAVEAVLFHSARAASAFVALAAVFDLQRVEAWCLSARVAAAARARAWAGVRIAAAPREAALLALAQAP